MRVFSDPLKNQDGQNQPKNPTKTPTVSLTFRKENCHLKATAAALKIIYYSLVLLIRSQLTLPDLPWAGGTEAAVEPGLWLRHTRVQKVVHQKCHDQLRRH